MPLTGPERTDDQLIKGRSIHRLWHLELGAPRDELTAARDAAIVKLRPASEGGQLANDVEAHNDPRFLQGLHYELTHGDNPLTDGEADAEIIERTTMYNDKWARKQLKLRLMDVEIVFRNAGKVDRSDDLITIMVPD